MKSIEAFSAISSRIIYYGIKPRLIVLVANNLNTCVKWNVAVGFNCE
jgi:hypothetical protein